MEKQAYNDKDFQVVVGNLLRYGVWISLSIAFIGGIIYLINHGNETVDYSVFIENDKNILQVVSSVLSSVTSLNGKAVILLGVIILFLTPALRVVLSLFSFLIEKDYLYTVITIIVMVIIGISISFGFSH